MDPTRFLTAAALHLGAAHTVAAPQQLGDAVQAIVDKAVTNAGVPGMAAAIADSRGVRAVAAAGVRKQGDKTPFTADDQVHLGSCTKAMTASLIGLLVDEGKLAWDSKLIDVVPELRDKAHVDYHEATLWSLLTHRAGFPANASWWSRQSLPMHERRVAILAEGLAAASSGVGEHHYSNVGYVAAGVMAEAVTGKTWEELMRERLFEPLGMKSAGFGPPGAIGKVEQPWGHRKGWFGLAGWSANQIDNAPALGPAGTVHATAEDWAKFLAVQLSDGPTPLLKPETLQRLHTPDEGDDQRYAGGWMVRERGWGEGEVLWHNGSNTSWYALTWVAPNTDRSYLCVVNAYDANMHGVADGVISELIRLDRELAKDAE